ncbi:MAG TPA: HRDC domain-containing protein, partial [Acidimicrobiales bacterium]|nr:HRDC domain-containing protein [Acidimicrobiales bacterium]
YLRIAADPARIDGADLAEVYRRPSRGLPQWIVKWFRGPLTVPGLRALAGRIDDEKVGLKVEDLADDLDLVVAAARGGTTRDVLAVVKNDVGLGGAMGLLDGPRAGEGSSHLDDLEALEQVASLHPDPAGFEPWLRSAFRREATAGGVTLSTVHRVKGREWPRVVVFGATAGLMPHRLAEDEEEERRVMHVAVTRGRHRVTVLADASRPSPFLDELTGVAPHHRARPPLAATLPGTGPYGSGPGTGTGTGTGPGTGGRAARARAAAGDHAPLSPAGLQAEAALRAWRRERSQRDGVPAYVVLNDRYLRGVAAARPGGLAELRRLPGIGPTKLELYGEEILGVLAALPPTAPATG